MRRTTIKVILGLILLAALLPFWGFEAASAAPFKAEKVSTKLSMDGVDEGYGEQQLVLGKAAVKMAVWQDRIFVLVSMKGSGWISAAFNRQGKGMDGANMVIGYLDTQGNPAVRNDLGKGWSHSALLEQPKIDFAFRQSEGTAYFEFSYPLAFREGFALKGLEEGITYSLVVAGNERSYSLSSKHTWAAKAEFTL